MKLSSILKTDTISEIKHMLTVKSDYVIRCYGYSEIEAGKGNFAIVMQYGGKQLDAFLDRFENGTEELREILEDLLIQVACGIYDIHQKGLMHRDIKGRLWFKF